MAAAGQYYKGSWSIINFLLPSRLLSHHFILLPSSHNHGPRSSLLTSKFDFHWQVDLQCHTPFSLNPCSTVKLPEAPEDKSVPLEVPTVGTELTLKNVLSYPVVYRLRFKARPGAQPSTSRSSKRGKHSIDPREDATGFLPSKTSRSVRGTLKR